MALKKKILRWKIYLSNCKDKRKLFWRGKKLQNLSNGEKNWDGADDIVFGRTSSGQENSAVRILINNVIDRTKYYTKGGCPCIDSFQK